MERIDLSINARSMATRTEIYIGRDLTGTLRSVESRYRKILVFVSKNVVSAQGEIVKSYTDCGITGVVDIEDGEDHKNIHMFEELLEHMMKASIERGDAIAYIGGGTLGDVCGFAASTYKRGVDLLAIPTTLLAQVDSSVGGKNGINFHGIKNLVGTFHQASHVFCDTDFIMNSDPNLVRDSLGEVVKYGLIGGPTILEILSQQTSIDHLIQDHIEKIIALCLSIKKNVVEVDPFDMGKRKVLNFGHTFGHVIEACYGGKLPHGNAVLLGIMSESEFYSEYFGLKDVCTDQVKSLIERYGIKIPHLEGCSPNDVSRYLEHDKKGSGDNITMAVVESLGSASLREVHRTDADSFLQRWLKDERWK